MVNNLFKSLKGVKNLKSRATKIFYVSPQRCGTKSFSQFFLRNDYPIASWKTSQKNGWPAASLDGRYEDILKSADFQNNSVFEDGPWNHVSLIKYLYWTVPGSRFVYFTRPVEDWLKSLKSHSKGRNPGDAKRHSMVYDRLDDYFAFKDRGLEPELRIEDAEAQYVSAFRSHRLQLRAFFEDKQSDRFFFGDLYDTDKWTKLSESWGITFLDDRDVHIHKSGFRKNVDHIQK